MARGFINYKKHGIWLNDAFTELFLIFIIRIIENKEYHKDYPWLKDAADWWKQMSHGQHLSVMELRLDEYLNSPDRVIVLSVLIDEAVLELEQRGEYITVEELQSYIIYPELQVNWTKPLEVKRLRRIFRFIKFLIQEKIKLDSTDSIGLF